MRPILILILIALASAVPGQKIRPKPTDLTLACGTGIQWAHNAESAFETARSQNRLVFWFIPTVPGSRMDRKDVIRHYMMSGLFQDGDIEALLNAQFVSLYVMDPKARRERARYRIPKEFADRYELKHLKFIEPGFLILTPQGRVVQRTDRISTFNSYWMRQQLVQTLTANPHHHHPLSPSLHDQNPGKWASALLDRGHDSRAEAYVKKHDLNATLPGVRSARLRQDATALEAAWRAIGDSAFASAEGLAVERMKSFLALNEFETGIKFAQRVRVASKEEGDGVQFLKAVCLIHSNNDVAAHKIWSSLAKSGRNNRWTQKASAESQRLGPTSRAFERWDWLPKGALVNNPEGTRVPSAREDLPKIVRRSVDLLLRHQRNNGSWDDSNYDFGGTDSLPNVYMAGTALAAKALLNWREEAPETIDAALEKAIAYMLDERHLALDDRDEILWAHVYRLEFFEACLQAGHGPAQKIRAKCRGIARALTESQESSGAWRHEYANPFATASTLHAWKSIEKEAKVPMGKKTAKAAAEALKACRSENGAYSYGMPRRGRSGRTSPAEFAAGRMPLCELALLLCGESDQTRLRAAIEASFKHHHLLETVRKYDDHADRYGNGGFFFWYDMHGRSAAIQAVTDAAVRKQYQEKLLDLVLSLTEIDGAFVDSHELGKTYGTAMGLVTLRRILEKRL